MYLHPNRSGIQKLRNYIQENRRWMFIFQPLGLMLMFGGMSICLLVMFHYIEGNLLLVIQVAILYAAGAQLFIFGKAYTNPGDMTFYEKYQLVKRIVVVTIVVFSSILIIGHYYNYYLTPI